MAIKLLMTVEDMQKNHDKWLAIRNNGLGGSDAAVIMGVSPFKSRLTLWMEKTGKLAPEDLSQNQRVYWGIKNEANIAAWFKEVTGKKTRRRGMIMDEDYPYMFANVDRMVDGEDAGLEIKTAGVSQAPQWKEDNVPDGYWLQCQWYMAVTGCKCWYIAVLIGGNEATWKKVERSDKQIAELRRAARNFWDMVVDEVMPTVDGNPDTATALSQLYPGGNQDPLQLDDLDMVEHYTRLKQLQANEKQIKEALAAEQNVFKTALGNHEAAFVNGNKVTWKTQAGCVTVDSKRLKAEKPDVFAQYSKVGNSTRVFKA